MNLYYSYCFLFLVIVHFQASLNLLCSADPTDGFTRQPLTGDNISLQKPYDKPLSERYSFTNGIRRFWVYANDKPFESDSPTRPRTELRIKGHDYSSGIWQFEGRVYVPSGTSGVTIMQVFGGRDAAASLQLRIYNGDLRYYSSRVIDTNMYDKWFRLNVIHNVSEGKITVFIDGVQKLEVADKGPSTFYFKCGVYAAPADSSNYMESRWRNVKIYRR